MYINLTVGAAQAPAGHQSGPGQFDQAQYGKPQYQTAYPMGGQPQYGNYQAQHQQNAYQGQQQQQQYGGQQSQQDQQMEMVEEQIKKNLPTIMRLCRSCCVVM